MLSSFFSVGRRGSEHDVALPFSFAFEVGREVWLYAKRESQPIGLLSAKLIVNRIRVWFFWREAIIKHIFVLMEIKKPDRMVRMFLR